MLFMFVSWQEFWEAFIDRFSYFGKAPLCNLNVEHGISIFDFYLPLCARCTGIFLGLLIFPIFLNKNISKYSVFLNFVSVVFIFPCIIDGMIQTFTVYESNNVIRLISGFLFSHGVLVIIFRVFDSITRTKTIKNES